MSYHIEDHSAVKCMLVFFYHAYNLKRRNKFVRPIINAIVTLELFLEHLSIVAILQNVLDMDHGSTTFVLIT